MKFTTNLTLSLATALISTSSIAQENNPSITIAGCTSDKFIEGGEFNEIKTSGISYTPKCLKVKVGSTVSIDGSSRHPLLAMPDINGIKNPFATNEPALSTQTHVMTEPGVFGYYCDKHGSSSGSGMAGVIIVEEATN